MLKRKMKARRPLNCDFISIIKVVSLDGKIGGIEA
jgi:hypothetical protein